jgi:hypothetical protein
MNGWVGSGPLTSADLMEPTRDGLKVTYQVGSSSTSSVKSLSPPVLLPFSTNSLACLLLPLGFLLNQGCLGAYSEAAARKAYPSCHTVPCEFFETAFQVLRVGTLEPQQDTSCPVPSPYKSKILLTGISAMLPFRNRLSKHVLLIGQYYLLRIP